MSTYYETNETMKMIGYQYPDKLIGVDGIASKDFKNLINAYVKNHRNDYFSLAMDGFLLGFIYGLREERAKRKK